MSDNYWTYKGSVLTDDMIPEGSMGFLYLITNKVDGRRYLGRKILTKAHRRQKNKKIIKSRVENDWRDYWSSSPEILGIIEKEGTINFTREILFFAPLKGQLLYCEECMQYSLGVLEGEGWYNSNIRAKVFRRNVIGKSFVPDLRESIKRLSN